MRYLLQKNPLIGKLRQALGVSGMVRSGGLSVFLPFRAFLVHSCHATRDRSGLSGPVTTFSGEWCRTERTRSGLRAFDFPYDFPKMIKSARR